MNLRRLFKKVRSTSNSEQYITNLMSSLHYVDHLSHTSLSLNYFYLSYRLATVTPAIPQWVFGTSVIITRIFSFGESNSSLKTSVIRATIDVIFLTDRPSISCIKNYTITVIHHGKRNKNKQGFTTKRQESTYAKKDYLEKEPFFRR
jgi:hypothetical protein